MHRLPATALRPRLVGHPGPAAILTDEQYRTITRGPGLPWPHHTPLQGLGIGRQRSWLAHHLTAHPRRRLGMTTWQPGRRDLLTWMDQAACADIDGFTDLPPAEAILGYCDHCAVKADCLTYGESSTPTTSSTAAS